MPPPSTAKHTVCSSVRALGLLPDAARSSRIRNMGLATSPGAHSRAAGSAAVSASVVSGRRRCSRSVIRLRRALIIDSPGTARRAWSSLSRGIAARSRELDQRGRIALDRLYASVAVGAAGVAEMHRGPPEAFGSVRLAFDTSYFFGYVFAAKAAGAFVAVFTTMLRGLAQSAGWMTVLGYAGALMLLFTIARVEWLLLVFPLWVLVVSVEILRYGTHDVRNAVSMPAASSLDRRGHAP